MVSLVRVRQDLVLNEDDFEADVSMLHVCWSSECGIIEVK